MTMVPHKGRPLPARAPAQLPSGLPPGAPQAMSAGVQLVTTRSSTPQAVIHTPVAHTAGSIVALVESLRDEARMLDTLANIMRTQRDAVARDDIDSVDQSVFATHRLLVNLGEARKRRRQLNQLLGETEDLSVAAISDFFGGTVPAEVGEAADRLAAAGRTLQREVEVNRRVLRHAIESGDRYVRALAGAATGAAAGAPRAETGGALVDRRA